MTELNSSAFEEKLQGPTPFVVDFWAEWCMPCKVFAPVLEELSGEMAGKVDFYKVNVDDNNALAVQYSVASIPTVILFQNGAEAARIVGVQAKEKVRALIEQHL